MTETATTTDPTTETAEQLQAAEAKRLKIAEALNAANEERRQLFATPITSNPLGQQARAVLESGDPDRADGRDPNSRAHELARKIESLTQAQRAVEGECRAALGAHHQAQLEAVAPAVDVALAAVLEQVPALTEAVVALNETVADAVEQLGPDGPPLVNPLRSQLQLRSGSLLAGLLVDGLVAGVVKPRQLERLPERFREAVTAEADHRINPPPTGMVRGPGGEIMPREEFERMQTEERKRKLSKLNPLGWRKGHSSSRDE